MEIAREMHIEIGDLIKIQGRSVGHPDACDGIGCFHGMVTQTSGEESYVAPEKY